MEILNHADTTLDHGEWLQLQTFVNRCVDDQLMQERVFRAQSPENYVD